LTIPSISIDKAIPSHIQQKLEKFPFTQLASSSKLRQVSASERRRNIKADLHCDLDLLHSDLKFLDENPEHETWLKDNVAPKFWLKFLSEKEKWRAYEIDLACGNIKRVGNGTQL